MPKKNRRKSRKSRAFIKKNSFLIFVFLMACILMFPNLGDRHFWGDEAHLVLIGEAIAKHGYPYVEGLEGTNEQLVNPIFYNEEYTYTFHPWLPMYVMSVPVLLFGKYNEFAVRFLFALFGIASILLTYFIALEFGFKKKTAKIAAIFALTSTALYLHSRNANYYSLSVLLALLMVYFYLKFIKEENTGQIVCFTAVCVLFFYTQFLIFASMFAGLAVHFAYHSYYNIRKEKSGRKTEIKKILSFIASMFLITALTAPWLIFAEITKQTSWINIKGILFNNIVGWFIVFVFAFPFVFLFGIPYVFNKRFSYQNFFKKKRRGKKRTKENSILLIPLMFIFTIAFLSLNSMTPPNLKYLLALFPLAYIMLAAIITRISEKSKAIALILILILVFSNLLHIFPFFVLKDAAQKGLSLEDYDEGSEKDFLNKGLSSKNYFPLYIYEITHDYMSAAGESINYINKVEAPSKVKNRWIFTNVDQMAHGFYTGINSTGNWSKLCIQTFDWVILYEKTAKDIEKKCFNPMNYRRFEIKNNADDWVEAPDLINHRFITKRDGIISIYKLKE